jgi:hypothetical protein
LGPKVTGVQTCALPILVDQGCYDRVVAAIRRLEREEQRPISVAEFVRRALVAHYGVDMSSK